MTSATFKHIKCKGTSSGTAVLIPGGPGLSSSTLKGFDALAETFDLVLVDPVNPRTVSQGSSVSYNELKKNVLAGVVSLPSRPLILLGHSFGGILAADLALTSTLSVSALICVATPFSQEAFGAIGRSFQSHMTDELKLASERFNRDGTSDSFRNWLASYGKLYFAREIDAGTELILKDDVCVEAFLGARSESAMKGYLLGDLTTSPFAKLFIAGELDILFPLASAKTDAAKGGFDFSSVQKAGHFCALDNPIETVLTIKNFLLQRGLM